MLFNLRIEKFEVDIEYRIIFFFGVEFTIGVEFGSFMFDREKFSQMIVDDIQVFVIKYWFLIFKYILSVELDIDSLLGVSEVTVSVSIAVLVVLVISDEWDDIKLESVSQIKILKFGDNIEIQVRMDIFQIV